LHEQLAEQAELEAIQLAEQQTSHTHTYTHTHTHTVLTAFLHVNLD